MEGNDSHDHTSVTCHSYTHARRFPLVIGNIGGFALPTPLSPSQIGTLLGSFFVMLAARRWWGGIVPGLGDALLLVVVPATLTWAVRHLRMEGRSPVKMLVGIASLLLAPTQGTVRGRQVWTKARPQRLLDHTYIAGDDTPDHVVARRPQLHPAPGALTPASPWDCLDEDAA